MLQAQISSSQVSSVTGGCTFHLGTAINPFFFFSPTGRANGSIDAWEGWRFSDNHFISSTVNIKLGNSINFANNEFVSAHVLVDSMYNTIISGNYFDTDTTGTTLLTVTNTYHNIDALQIESNHFQCPKQCIYNHDLLRECWKRLLRRTNVTLTGNMYARW